jgi:hypothetical protein
LEGKIAKLDRHIETHKPVDVSTALVSVREFAERRLGELRSILSRDAQRAKAALAEHLQPFVLTPKETPAGLVYDVSGHIPLGPAGVDVVPMVARDGIGWQCTALALPVAGVTLNPRA